MSLDPPVLGRNSNRDKKERSVALDGNHDRDGLKGNKEFQERDIDYHCTLLKAAESSGSVRIRILALIVSS